MIASFQTLMEEVKDAVFEKDELEHRDMFQLEAFLPPLSNQYFNSDVETKFHDTYKRIVRLKYKAID